MSQIRVGQIKGTGTPSPTTYLRGDGTWDTPGAAAGVSSFNTRSGAVTLTKADVTGTGLAAADVGAQPSDSDLTAIAALTTTTFGRSLLALADAAAGRTALGLGTAATAAAGAFDAAGAAAAALAASQPLDSDLTAIAALATTIYGRSLLTAADAAATKTLLALVKADVNLGSVDNTADAAKAVLSATKLTTARTVDGQSFDGTANVTVIAPGTHAATSKATPVDADEIPLVDTAASNVLKRLTWANLKATAKTYFDTLYAAAPLVATKGGNTGRTNNTLADDADLTVSAVANTTYLVDITLLVNGSASGDFKWTVSAPLGASGSLAILNAVATTVTALPGAESVFAALAVNDATGQTVGAIATGTVQIMRIIGVIVVAATAGPITFRWAQGTTNATATTVQANSHMRLQKTA